MYYYTAYGLLFSSQVELPEFMPADKSQNYEVSIRLGDVPEHLENPLSTGVLYQADAHSFLLNVDNVARYLVEEGKKITIYPYPQALAGDIRVFLLGSCLGALLHQRGMLALHASAVATEQGAAVFIGPSGAGKSTLLNALLQRGYTMLADDITLVSPAGDSGPEVIPGFPRTKLWADAARQLQINISGLTRTRPQLEKYEYHVPEQLAVKPAEIKHIYHLNMNNNNELSLCEISKMYAMQTLVLNTYRHQYLDGLAMRESHFHLLTEVAQEVSIFKVTRPRGGLCRIGELSDIIEEKMKNDFSGLRP